MMRFLLIIFMLSWFEMFSNYSVEDRYYFQTNISHAESLTILKKEDGTYSIINKNNLKETEIYDNYIVFGFKRSFPNTKRELLKTVYTIVTNDVKLLGALKYNFPEKYTRIDQFYPDEEVYYPNDYGSTSPKENLGTHYPLYDLDLINAPGAWGITKGSKKVVIGISDSKIDSTNADIKGRVSNYLKYFNTRDGLMTCAHGTNVAGIAIATMDNAFGRPGICPECDVITNGYGRFQHIEELVEAGARVINTSWALCSMGAYHENIEERINEFYDDGILIVAGAGNAKNCNNDGNPPDDYAYPASFEKVISVTGVYATYDDPKDNIFIGKEGKRATSRLKDRHIREFAVNKNNKIIPKHLKWGMQRNASIDICAPAESYLLGHDYCGLEKTWGGATSSTAPYITGVIGLMWSVNYCLSAYEVESILKLTAADIENLPGNTKFKTQLGAGRVDAYKAVKMAKSMKEIKGNVMVEDRNFYRFNFKLENSPYNIIIQNQIFRDSAKVDFKARNAIIIKSNTTLKPDKTGAIHLSIDPDIPTGECFKKPPKNYKKISSNLNNKSNLINKLFIISLDSNSKNIIITPGKELIAESTYTVQITSKNNEVLIKKHFEVPKSGVISIESLSNQSISVEIRYKNKRITRNFVINF